VFPLLPLRRRWLARITEFEWNRYFADVQDEGPFKRWHHRHEFASAWKNETEGTTIRDIIDYDVGFGFLGSIANALFVRRQMQSTFAERQRKLPELLQGFIVESPPAGALRP
jgi:ligand-binding SRPBCC domain-containing protein